MASHSLMRVSTGRSVGHKSVVENLSKSSSKGKASSNTRDVTLNSRPISAKPNVQVALDSKSGMVVKPTSQAYGRGFHVSVQSVVNTFVIGLALLSGKTMAEPCDSSKTYMKSVGCGVNSSTVGACDIQDELFVTMGNAFNTSAVEYGNCTASNGAVFPLLHPNVLDIENATEEGFTCVNWQLLNDTMRQTIQSGDRCDVNLLNTQCFYWTNYLFSQFLNSSQCEYLTDAPTPSPTANAVSNGSSESYDFKLVMELIIASIFLLDFLGWVAHFSSFGQRDTVPQLNTVGEAKDHLLEDRRYQNDEVVNEVGLNGVLKKFSQSRTSKAMHLAYRLKNYGKLGVAVGMLVQLNRLNDRQMNAELFAAYLFLDGLSSIYQKTVFDVIRSLQQVMIGCCCDLEGFNGLNEKLDQFEFFKKASPSNFIEAYNDVSRFFNAGRHLDQDERNAIAQISNRYPFVEFNDRNKLLKLALPDLVNYIPYALLIYMDSYTDESKGLLTPLISAGVTSLISKVGKFYARQDSPEFQFLKMAKLTLDDIDAVDFIEEESDSDDESDGVAEFKSDDSSDNESDGGGVGQMQSVHGSHIEEESDSDDEGYGGGVGPTEVVVQPDGGVGQMQGAHGPHIEEESDSDDEGHGEELPQQLAFS